MKYGVDIYTPNCGTSEFALSIYVRIHELKSVCKQIHPICLTEKITSPQRCIPVRKHFFNFEMLIIECRLFEWNKIIIHHFTLLHIDAKAAEAAQSAYYDPNRPQCAYVPPPAYYVSSICSSRVARSNYQNYMNSVDRHECFPILFFLPFLTYYVGVANCECVTYMQHRALRLIELPQLSCVHQHCNLYYVLGKPAKFPAGNGEERPVRTDLGIRRIF